MLTFSNIPQPKSLDQLQALPCCFPDESRDFVEWQLGEDCRFLAGCSASGKGEPDGFCMKRSDPTLEILISSLSCTSHSWLDTSSHISNLYSINQFMAASVCFDLEMRCALLCSKWFLATTLARHAQLERRYRTPGAGPQLSAGGLGSADPGGAGGEGFAVVGVAAEKPRGQFGGRFAQLKTCFFQYHFHGFWLRL